MKLWLCFLSSVPLPELEGSGDEVSVSLRPPQSDLISREALLRWPLAKAEGCTWCPDREGSSWLGPCVPGTVSGENIHAQTRGTPADHRALCSSHLPRSHCLLSVFLNACFLHSFTSRPVLTSIRVCFLLIC